jgi:hypothetical protein
MYPWIFVEVFVEVLQCCIFLIVLTIACFEYKSLTWSIILYRYCVAEAPPAAPTSKRLMYFISLPNSYSRHAF